LSDVQRFFKQYYTPNNASLAIVGDIDKAKTMQLVEKYFGTLKKGPNVPPVRATTPAITSERRVTVQDRIELPRLYMAWITPSIFKPGDAEATLAAGILGGGKSSRLYKSLVYEKQIAQDVTVEQWSFTLGSTFIVSATARKGHTLDEIEKEIQTQLDAIRKSPPERSELDRAKAYIETQAYFSLERLGGFNGIADRINMYNHHVKNPDYFTEDIMRFRRVTPGQVLTFAQKYLSNTSRVVVRGVPGTPNYGTPVPTPDNAATPTGAAQSVNPDEPWRNQRPASGVAAALKIPSPEQFKLSNGLSVVVDQRKTAPVVSANLVIRSGTGANPVDKPGLASLTVDMLDEGTSSRSAVEFADQLAQIGATLNTSALLDSSSLRLGVTKSRFAAGLDLLADAVLNPTFAPDELDRQRQQRLGSLLQQKEDPGIVADRVVALAMNGPRSSYGYPELGTEESLR
jgi:zinc protease